MKSALRGYNFFQSPDKERISAQLDQIEAYLKNQLGDARELETEDYEIGRATGQLRREMSRIYSVEFAKWVSATQFKTIELLRNFQTIFESEQRDQQFQVFENILGEALEVTSKIRKLNKDLISSLKEDIAKLEKITPDEMQESSYSQMVVELKKRKLGQEQFEGTLLLVMQSFRATLVAARAVRESDMNILTAQILEALKGKSSLEEVDQENPIVVLLNSVQGLNANLGGLGITPDQAQIGLTLTGSNLQESVDQCRDMANDASFDANADSILESCFEKLQEAMSAEQCHSLALAARFDKNRDNLIKRCVRDLDPTVSSLTPELCRDIAVSAAFDSNRDEALFGCFEVLKDSMALDQCNELAKAMAFDSNRDSLKAMCVEGS